MCDLPAPKPGKSPANPVVTLTGPGIYEVFEHHLSLTLKKYMSKCSVEATQRKTYSFIQLHFFTPTMCQGSSWPGAEGFTEGRPSSQGWKLQIGTRLAWGLHGRLRNLDIAQVWHILADLEAGKRQEKRNNLGEKPRLLLPGSLIQETFAGAAEGGEET